MDTQTNTEVVQRIPLADLQRDPKQPRKYFDKKALQELANDIAQRGIIEPIIVFTAEDGKNTILAGERRYRAAALAELETVPCLLRAPGSGLERLLDQVSENFQREGLNPIEMALFFETLVNEHEVTPAALPAFLVKYGFKKFDRSYISNIRRLLQLPKWAQTLIQKDKITAAHGKYLLQALPSVPVMQYMQAFLKKPCTTKQLRDEIEKSYDDMHVAASKGKYITDAVVGYERWQSTKFDFRKECKDCGTCQIFATEYYTTLYCLNEPCYDEKQQDAITRAEKAEQRKLKAAETKRKNALEKQAEEQGVSVEELEAAIVDPQNDSRANARKERTQEYLDEWIRDQLKDHLLDDQPETRYALLLWIAADKPDDWNYWTDVDLFSVQETWGEMNLMSFLKTPLSHAAILDEVIQNSLQMMSRDNLRALSHYCGIKLEGKYVIDRAYFDIKTKSEIIESTPGNVIQVYDDGYLIKLPVEEIKDRLLDCDHIYGVPADLDAMYNAPVEL